MQRKTFLTGLGAAPLLASHAERAYAQSTSFTIGSVMDPTICTPLLVAQDKGIFAKHNVPVTVKLFPSGAPITQAISGKSLEFGATGGVPGTFLAAHQVGVRCVARISDISWELTLMAMPKSGITKPADLAGKTIGMANGTVSQYLVFALADHWNIPLSSLKMVNLSPADMVNALLTDKIDAASLWLPFVTHAQEGGAIPLESALKSYWPGTKSDVRLVGDPGILFGTNDFLDKNADVTVRMLQAISEAEDWMHAHVGDAADVASGHLGVSAQSLADNFKKSQIYMSYDQRLVDDLRAEWEFLRKQGLIDTPFKAEGWIDPSFMRRAVPRAVSVS
jgi:ABC-type nitrate/sulfonate/bicarbonate transport system substrate-binding protein